MSKSLKMMIVMMVTTLVSLSLFSCTQTNIQHESKDSFTLFTPISTDYPSVDNPKLAWTYHWPEKYESVLEAMTAPAADVDGNCYFIGENYYLYSLSPSGEVRWNKKDYYHPRSVDKLTITQEGILAKSGSLQLISFDGDIMWKKDIICTDYYLAPNGTLYCFTFDDEVLGIDSKGKTMWTTKDIPQNTSLEGAFFDTSSNGYFVLSYPEEDTGDFYTCIISISPTGEIHWNKTLPHKRINFIDDFLPNNTIQDTFLLAYTTDPGPESENEEYNYYTMEKKEEKILEAYNLDFEKVWEVKVPRMGIYEDKYAVSKDNNFVIVFNEVDVNTHNYPLINSYLTCFSKEGTKMWERAFDYSIATCPTFDAHENMYLWFYSPDYSLCSMNPDGSFRWTYYLEDSIGCKFPVTLSPVGSIFTTSKYQSLMFCVK